MSVVTRRVGKVVSPVHHYQDDTCAWECNREEEIRNVMFPSWYDGIHKFHLASSADNSIDRTIWKYPRDVPAPGETLIKSLGSQPFCWQPAQNSAGFARL